MRPRVITHNAVSIDGQIEGFAANLGVYYGLIGHWQEDATLVGTGTVLRAMAAEPPEDDSAAEDLARDPADTRPLLVVPDSRGRVRTWSALRRSGYWRDCLALVSRQTPAEYLAYARSQRVRTLAYGDDHVDLAAALEDLAEREGVRTVRVDSGGTLNGVLLWAGLVDEISVLVHPVVVGGETRHALFGAAGGLADQKAMDITLEHLAQLEGGLVWLRYSVRAARATTASGG
jgi:2,5-diamino-6-(ribosylamino)-4(3H)-pyrimidinone 5'-phosphate reductase